MDVNTAISIAIPFTESFEGFEASPYQDGTGYAIGYGNHYYSDGSSVEATDDPISQSDAIDLLTYYETAAANGILNWLQVPQTNNQLAALTDLAYNAGSVYTSLQALINSGADSQTVANTIAKTAITAGGVPNSDLTKRAAARAALYLTPDSLIPGIDNVVLIGGVIAITALILIFGSGE